MPKQPLFTDDGATDRGFINIRAASSPRLKACREHCEALWEKFEPFADNEFRTELRRDFDARYWEMHLTTYFIDRGFEVHCPKPGPDVGIDYRGQRIWFEATSPGRGADNSPDQVPTLKLDGTVNDVPNDQILLRYLNSVSDKHLRQRALWLAKDTISEKDAFVIALNPRGTGFDYADTSPARILQVAYPLGPAYVTFNKETMKATGSGYAHRADIAKAKGKAVQTGVFYQATYHGLSALLCSRVDVGNLPDETGADFQLVPNPYADVPLANCFRLNGTYFRTIIKKSGSSVVAETTRGSRGDDSFLATLWHCARNRTPWLTRSRP